ncbi:MAG: metal-dependent hydrolase [Saprospiraceae bacterium]|nr:metal-dependent hydrolase [Saprospiraceae bacterium]
MDSITQATLGAAMGEAALGKKMKNKALIWGALAGTIPDLDVISRLFISDPIYGLVYHRGLTHSIFFTLVAPPLFAFLAHWYYQKDLHNKKGMKIFWTIIGSLLYSLLLFGLGLLVYRSPNAMSIGFLGLGLLGGFFLVRNYIKSIQDDSPFIYEAKYIQWVNMFFWAFLTHWFIDACTSYGTQIFEPFDNTRVTFNNISIVDPLYTVPFLLSLILVSRTSKVHRRVLWNWLGIVISSGYLAFSFINKSHAEFQFYTNLEEQDIEYTQFETSPTIGNIILWQAVAEGPDNYYYGMYSLMDNTDKIKFKKLPKNHELLDPYREHEHVKILTWFAGDYYNITPVSDSVIKFNNLRFGLMGGDMIELKDPYPFGFYIKDVDGKVTVTQRRPQEEIQEVNMRQMLGLLWNRIKGKKPQANAK